MAGLAKLVETKGRRKIHRLKFNLPIYIVERFLLEIKYSIVVIPLRR